MATCKVQEYFPNHDCAAESPGVIFKYCDYGIQECTFPTAKAALVPASLWQLSL